MRSLIALGTIFLSTAAASQTPAPALGQGPGGSGGLVCRITGETGSRLQRTRTCKTRAEWAQDRLAQRNAVDRAQTRQVNRTPDETDRMH